MGEKTLEVSIDKFVELCKIDARMETLKAYIEKAEKKGGCYETLIKVVIDENTYFMQTPVMNGSNPVKDNSMTQQRVWNSMCIVNYGFYQDCDLEKEQQKNIKGTAKEQRRDSKGTQTRKKEGKNERIYRY